MISFHQHQSLTPWKKEEEEEEEEEANRRETNHNRNYKPEQKKDLEVAAADAEEKDAADAVEKDAADAEEKDAADAEEKDEKESTEEPHVEGSPSSIGGWGCGRSPVAARALRALSTTESPGGNFAGRDQGFMGGIASAVMTLGTAGILAGFSSISQADNEQEGQENKNVETGAVFSDEEDGAMRFKVFSGSGNPTLAAEIAESLGISLGNIRVGKFADGEIDIQVMETVRGEDVYIVQSTCYPSSDNLMELLLLISTMRRAAANRITAVIPYYGYKRDTGAHPLLSARSNERKTGEFRHDKEAALTPISASEVATMLEVVGVDRILAVDLQHPGHGTIEAFFDTRVPVDVIEGTFAGVEYFRRHHGAENMVIVAPNESCVKKARDFQTGIRGSGYVRDGDNITRTNIGLAIMVRQKSAPAMRGREGDYSVSSGAKDDGDGEEVRSQLGNLQLVGNVEGRHVIIVDDMIATGKSLVTVAKLLKAEGAKSVSCFATHGVFAGNAMEVIDECDELDEVVVTNTIPARQGVQISNKVKYLSLGCVIADVIEKINLKDSLRKTSLVVYAADEEDDARYASQEN